MYLSYNNVSALKLMDNRNNWVLASEKNKVTNVCMFRVELIGFSSILHSYSEVLKIWVIVFYVDFLILQNRSRKLC